MKRLLLSFLRFPEFDPKPEIVVLNEDSSTKEIELGALFYQSQSRGDLRIFPIIDGILILLDPDRIVDSFERKKISNLLISIARSFRSYRKECFKYIRHMNKVSSDTKTKEFSFYEKKYQRIFQQTDGFTRQYGDHWYNAVRDVLVPMTPAIRPDASILEIAGGDFSTFPSVFSPKKHNYFFVGTEASYWGLRCGRLQIPEGQFIQLDTDNLKFRIESFDAIFVKGAIHHQFEGERILPLLLSLLRSGGILGLMEVVRGSKGSNPVVRLFKKMIERYKTTSPMNDSIDRNKALKYLVESCDILAMKERMSLPRYLMVKLFKRRKLSSYSVSRMIVLIDDFINSLPLLKSRWLTATHILLVASRKK